MQSCKSAVLIISEEELASSLSIEILDVSPLGISTIILLKAVDYDKEEVLEIGVQEEFIPGT